MLSMPSKNPSQRLCDIVENIDAIEAFTDRMDFDAFAADRKTVYAVVRALEIISEASRRLPDDLKGRHPDIDWVAVSAAGNIYRHEYDAVDERLVWHTARHDSESVAQRRRDGVGAAGRRAVTKLCRKGPALSPTT
jgi:uncharacterized protein with HEPN domain